MTKLDQTDIRFQTLFEQAPISVQLLGTDGRTLRVNKAWETLWQASEDEGLKAYVLGEYNILTDPQLAAKGITPLIQRAFAGESVKLPLIAYDPAEIGRPGQVRWVKAQMHAVRDAQGEVCEVMLIHEDVTDQVRAEQALRASEERLKQLANSVPQLVWMADPEGAIHWYNDRWYEFTGTTAEEMVGWGWQRVHDPDVLPQVLEKWRNSIRSGTPFQLTFPLRGRDGRFRLFLTLVAPLKNDAGEVLQWFGTNTDVSALHDAEQGLRLAEERLRLAVEAGGIGIWDWDVSRDVVNWSDEVYALHGLPIGSFGGHVADFAARVHPDDRDRVGAAIQAAVDASDSFAIEFRVVLPDGHDRWLSTWARVERGPSGKASRMIGATISIDAYKKAEAALRESDRRKDEFLAMLSHELRNPLAPISAASALLRASVADESKVRRASEIIDRQVKHVVGLVDDLLDTSRVTRGLMELRRTPIDLKEVLDNAVEQARPTIDAKHHLLQMGSDSQPALVLGDGKRLVQAIANVLDNAAKYTPPGGTISVKLRVAGARAHLSIQDNGSGIDMALQRHVFELFTQGARAADRSQGGLGIGLAMVKGIVELHGGEVDVHSDGPGTGSTFKLNLPLLPASQRDDRPQSSASAAEPSSTSRPLRLLVVDDNRDAAHALQMLLEAAGHQVRVSHDGQAALAALQEQAPDVFILDIGLPDMDGYQLAQRLRPGAGGSAVFIALTGYGQQEDRERSKAAGFDHHLVKPVDDMLLARLLSSLSITPPSGSAGVAPHEA